MTDGSDVMPKAVEEGLRVYGRMLDLDDAHIEDAVRGGIKAAVDYALRAKAASDITALPPRGEP